MNNYTRLNKENFYLLQEQQLTALFVNSTEYPIEYIPTDSYQVSKINDKYEFTRLYELIYLCDNSIKYSVFKWLPVKVKPHLQETFYCHIKLLEGCKEFLL